MLGNAVAGDKVVDQGLLLVGQRSELHAEPFDPQGAEERIGQGLHLIDEEHRDVGQVKMRLGEKNIEGSGRGKLFFKNGEMNRETALADVQNGAGVLAKKHQGLVGQFKSCVMTSLLCARSFRLDCHDGLSLRPASGFAGVELLAVLAHQLPALQRTQPKINRAEHQDSDSFAWAHRRTSKLAVAYSLAKTKPVS